MQAETKFYRILMDLFGILARRLLNYLEPMHVGASGLLFMLYIRDHKGCRVSDIAHALRMDKAAVTRGLGPLGEMGYVEKQRAKIDTRTFNLYLTPAGRLVLRGARGILDEWEEEFQQSLSEKEYGELFEIMGQSKSRMMEQLARGGLDAAGKSLSFLS